jgi:hypothetical protein
MGWGNARVFCFWIFDRGFVSARDNVFYGCLGTEFSFLQKVVFFTFLSFPKKKGTKENCQRGLRGGHP